MSRRLTVVAALLLLAAPLHAQQPAGGGGRAGAPAGNPNLQATAPGLVLPTGTTPTDYRMRLDASTDAADPDDSPNVKVIRHGNAVTVATGPAALLYKETDRATGNYTLKGTFTLLAPSAHTNFYGLMIGGQNLGAANESYLYFLVAQNGNYIVKWRRMAVPEAGGPRGNESPTIVPSTAHAAVVRPDETGRSVNNLEVRVTADKIDFVVNGQVVTSLPKTGLEGTIGGAAAGTKVPVTSGTDGIWGFRINHVIPGVTVENLEVVPGSN